MYVFNTDELAPKRCPIIPAMDKGDAQSGEKASQVSRTDQVADKCDSTDAMICERCGKAEMYRMHAVWRCPECGFKTDCCGW
jgi:predicted RNA-binding Zn-ribbon protein involved in translation (DUF1610 family)